METLRISKNCFLCLSGSLPITVFRVECLFQTSGVVHVNNGPYLLELNASVIGTLMLGMLIWVGATFLTLWCYLHFGSIAAGKSSPEDEDLFL